MKMQATIKTDRLFIRPFQLADTGPFAAICADVSVMQYIGNGVLSYEQTQEKVKQYISDYRKNGFGLMAVTLINTNQFIGFCGLIHQFIGNKKYIELGYRLARNHWQQGLATEAALAVKNHAFDQLNLPELISIIHPENHRSKKVAFKVGMQLYKHTVFQGIDVEIYRALPK